MNAHTWRDFSAARVIVMAAPNGARRSRADHPALPVTTQELADEAVSLRDAGTSILHLHVRDEAGAHTLDAERYADAIAAIRARVGDELIVQVTTEAVGRYTAEEQMRVVRRLRPEAVSLALAELLPKDGDEMMLREFLAELHAAGTWPQYILYSESEVQRFAALRASGVFPEVTPFVLLVLGSYRDQRPGRVEELHTLLPLLDAGQLAWAVCCFGPAENAVMHSALGNGGHVRIGFENNLLLADGAVAANNAALIRQFTAALEGQARRPATADEIRQCLQRLS